MENFLFAAKKLTPLIMPLMNRWTVSRDSRINFRVTKKRLGGVFFCARRDHEVRSRELGPNGRASRHDRDRHVAGDHGLRHNARAADENELHVEPVLFEKPSLFGNPYERLAD